MADESYHLLKGSLSKADGEEAIQIEYRFLKKECELYTKIKGQVFHKKGKDFFSSIADLLDSLQPKSSIVLNHTIPIKKLGVIEFVPMEEWLLPYDIKGSGTVIYRLKLTVDDVVYETKPSTDFGGSQGIAGGALEQLRVLTRHKFDIQVCYFCKFLIEYNEYGGTDYRHDQLYCFRGKPRLLQKLNEVYPNLKGQENILKQTISNISALHSCDAFDNNTKPRL